MIWTERVHQLVEDIIKLVSKGVMEFSDTDCVFMPTDKDIKWQEIQEVVKFFQSKGFEATWYQTPNHVSVSAPVIMVTWGVPEDINKTNDMYANGLKMLENYGNNINKFVDILAEYLSYVYLCSRKSVCVIPLKYLDYICGNNSVFFNYNIFKNVIDRLSTRYHLKVQFGTFDGNECDIDYISIQKSEQNG